MKENKNKYDKKMGRATFVFLLAIIIFIIWLFGSPGKFIQNYYSVYTRSGNRAIDSEGRVWLNTTCRDISGFNSNGVAFGSYIYTTGEDGPAFVKCGFLDSEGNLVYKEAAKKTDGWDRDFYDYIYIDEDLCIGQLEKGIAIVFLESADEFILENVLWGEPNVGMSEDLFLVWDFATLKYGFINKYAEWVIPPSFKGARNFSEGMACVRAEDGSYGYIDHQGNYVIEPQFSDADAFSEGYAAVRCENGLYGYIDKSGNMVIDPVYKSAGAFSDGMAFTELEVSGKTGFINAKGEQVIDLGFDESRGFSGGFAAVKDKDTKTYTYIDKTGKQAFPNEFFNAEHFTEDGYAVVEVEEDKFTYIDKNGNFLLEPQFGYARDFNNGYGTVHTTEGSFVKYDLSDGFDWKMKYTINTKVMSLLYKGYYNGFKYAMIFMSVYTVYMIILYIKYLRIELKPAKDENAD